MPVCAGRPDDRPCPDNKKDSSFKFSICDLFLCKACYDVRKPLTIVGDNTQSAMSSKAACMIPTTPSCSCAGSQRGGGNSICIADSK